MIRPGNFKMIRAYLFIIILLSFDVMAVSAQNAAQNATIQQLQNSQMQMQMPQPQLQAGTNAPELYAGENEDIGPQYILRVNNQKARRKWLEITLDSQAYYSDDANFAQGANAIGSYVFVNTLQLSLAPDPFTLGPGKFGPSAGFYSQWYNYSSGRMKPLDFDAQTAFVNLRYFIGNWLITAGGNYTRLVSQPYYSQETYNELLPSFTVQRAFAIGSTAAVIVGDTVDYHFTHVPSVLGTPDRINDHLDNLVWIALNWQINSHLAAQPFVRYQFSNYRDNAVTTSDRNDNLLAAGFTVVYSFNQYVSARAFFNFTRKTSDDVYTPSYTELNGGLGATLDIKF
jgi:hypothetical protein